MRWWLWHHQPHLIETEDLKICKQLYCENCRVPQAIGFRVPHTISQASLFLSARDNLNIEFANLLSLHQIVLNTEFGYDDHQAMVENQIRLYEPCICTLTEASIIAFCNY